MDKIYLFDELIRFFLCLLDLFAIQINRYGPRNTNQPVEWLINKYVDKHEFNVFFFLVFPFEIDRITNDNLSIQSHVNSLKAFETREISSFNSITPICSH